MEIKEVIRRWQLGGLMGGVTLRCPNQVLRSLRRRSRVRREGKAHVLTDEGLSTLARRDRADGGTALDRWTPQHEEDGADISTVLRAIASQCEHQAGITGSKAFLSTFVKRIDQEPGLAVSRSAIPMLEDGPIGREEVAEAALTEGVRKSVCARGREIVEDEPPTLRVADDCEVAEHQHRSRSVRRFTEVHRAFDAARALVQRDEFTVVAIH